MDLLIEQMLHWDAASAVIGVKSMAGNSNEGDAILSEENSAPDSGGFMRFYGLYWDKKLVWTADEILAGIPTGWTGRGRHGASFDPDALWMNFWNQKGVYVLYDDQLTPVYAGQAGVARSNTRSSGGTVGNRLAEHKSGKYRNGWEYFSWFGFLEAEKESQLKSGLKKAALDDRKNPGWKFRDQATNSEHELNQLLDSFEAILIEAFTPRFNSRGGNLKNATYVDQFESTPRFIQERQQA